MVEDDVIIGAGAEDIAQVRPDACHRQGCPYRRQRRGVKSVPAGEVWAGVPARKVGTNPNVLDLPDPDFAANNL